MHSSKMKSFKGLARALHGSQKWSGAATTRGQKVLEIVVFISLPMPYVLWGKTEKFLLLSRVKTDTEQQISEV